MKKQILIYVLVPLFFFTACQKEEGPGGRATIKGKIYVQDYTGTTLVDQFYGPDYDVFIIYGDGSNFYDDNVKTSYDGSYEFRYLRPGTYRIFAYSKEDSAPGGIQEVMETVEISGKKDIVELDDIVIKD